MDEQNKPNARKKRIVGAGKGIEKQGEGLGTGPVGQSSQRPPQSVFGQSSQQRPAQNPFSQSGQSTQRPTQTQSGQNAQRPSQSPFYQASQNTQRPQHNQYSQNTQRPSQNPFTQNAQRTDQSPFGQATNSFGQSQRPQQSSQRPSQSTQRPASARPSQAAQGSGQTQRSGSSSGGGGNKLILLIAAAAILFFFGKGFLGGDNGGSDLGLTTTSTTSQTQTQTQSQTQTQTQTQTVDSSSGIMNLLSSFLGSSGSSAYDFSGMLSGLTGGGTGGTVTASDSSQYFTTSMENNTPEADTTVSSKARDKYTVIRGGNKDTITVLVYMCGADLESQNGMATSDLKEMVNANLSDNINLLVYTGGARRWKNNVVSASCNQIYKIENKSLTRLVENDGNASMTSPSTLASFIKYGSKNYPANRMVLIFWDHGGGSVSGYGYDERYGQGQTMTLAGINEALQSAGVKFDFIGFDTCLMATVENGLMMDRYADYMIASEESEPGTGWYYTNWLNKISSDPGMSTVKIGKTIVDDFVEVSNRQCRGQATTLSVVDLAELSATVPKELKEFSIDTNNLIQNNQYKKVSTARSKTREFAQQSRIDQIDLIHFAKNLETKEGNELAEALQGAIKYNRTGGGISNAYGLSIYFPYKKTGNVNKIVSTYKAIGMDDEYTRCIQEFASLEVSGQLSGGSTPQSYGSSNAMSSLMESLMGGSGSYGSIGSTYSSGGLEELLSGYYDGGSSGGSTGSILDLLMGRSMNAEKAAAYIQENHFDPSSLQWENGRISLTDEQWSNLISIEKNLYYDDGQGYINMGFDPAVERQGNDLIYEFDGTWLSIDRQPVAYYRIGLVEQEDYYVEVGYVPAFVNDIRANLIIVFDAENPYGYIAGAEPVYTNGETDTQAKNMTGIGKGDRIQFICDYYDYQGNYLESYKLGSPITLGDETEIGNTYVDAEKCRLTYCLTDIYQQQYWTPVQ